MKIKDLVSDEIKKQLGYKPKRHKFTKREIEDLMDIRKPRYRRKKGGAFRQV